MAHLGTLGQYKFQDNIDDVRGTDVYDRDNEKLGTVDDVIFDHDSCEIRHVVVDSGGWLRTHKFTVPADRISIRDEGDLETDLTREQIQQRFPGYDENVHQSGRWDDYERRHREAYSESGGVLHKEGSANTITPDPDQMPAASGDIQGDFTPDRLAGRFNDPAPSASKLNMRPSGTAARAEDTKRPGTAQNTETAHWQDPDISERKAGQSDNSEQGTSAYGDIGRTAVPDTRANDPSAYREKFDGVTEDLHRPYPVQRGRNQRFRDFEETLRRNRVDITASCHSCSPARDKAA